MKADGLAAGKGVTVAMTVDEANAAIDDAFGGNAFGALARKSWSRSSSEGEEASFFVLTDGETALPLATAQDHKAVGEGDTGPNTGGMGAYSPAPVMTRKMVERIDGRRSSVRPSKGMAADGAPYQGVLYAGLMIDGRKPKLLEYNVRFDDPECQVLMDAAALRPAAGADGRRGRRTRRFRPALA